MVKHGQGAGRVAYVVTAKSGPIFLVWKVLGNLRSDVHSDVDALGLAATSVVEPVVTW